MPGKQHMSGAESAACPTATLGLWRGSELNDGAVTGVRDVKEPTVVLRQHALRRPILKEGAGVGPALAVGIGARESRRRAIRPRTCIPRHRPELSPSRALSSSASPFACRVIFATCNLSRVVGSAGRPPSRCVAMLRASRSLTKPRHLPGWRDRWQDRPANPRS